jgi:hypothetical protein
MREHASRDQMLFQHIIDVRHERTTAQLRSLCTGIRTLQHLLQLWANSVFERLILMKSELTIIAWTPNDPTNSTTRGKVRVGPMTNDEKPFPWSIHYAKAVGACDEGWQELTELERAEELKKLSRTLIDNEGLEAAAAHRELAKIDG